MPTPSRDGRPRQRRHQPGARPGASAPARPERVSAAVVERVRAVVEPAVTASGHVLEAVAVTPAGARRVVRVVVDLPEDAVGALSLDDLAVVSRAVDDALEADDAALGSAPYVLEVGTPGTSRPLTERRHWSRARTRLVAVPLSADPPGGGGAVEVVGRVVAVGDAGVVLDVEGAERAIAWERLGTGRLELEFSRPGEEPGADENDDDTDENDGED